MNKKSFGIILLIVLTISQSLMVFQVQTDPISADKRPQTKIGDMDRVQLRMNNFMNPGFEDWSNPH
ncbi:MAG: hypothetical protein ACTSR2_11525, partial [Candidatus Hodarchaeales archaeon]